MREDFFTASERTTRGGLRRSGEARRKMSGEAASRADQGRSGASGKWERGETRGTRIRNGLVARQYMV